MSVMIKKDECSVFIEDCAEVDEEPAGDQSESATRRNVEFFVDVVVTFCTRTF